MSSGSVYHGHSRRLLTLRQSFAASLLEGNMQQALRKGGALMNDETCDRTFWAQMGKLLLISGQTEESMNAFRKLNKCSSDDVTADSDADRRPVANQASTMYAIGLMYMKLGHIQHAKKAFESVLNLNEDISVAYDVRFRLGLISLTLSDFSKALQVFRRQYFHRVLDDPLRTLNTDDIFFHISRTFQLQGHSDRALTLTRQLLDRNGNQRHLVHHFVHTLLTSTHQPSQEDLLDAVSKLESVSYRIKSDIDNPLETDTLPGERAIGAYLIGRCYLVMQRFQDAVSAFETAVEFEGHNPTFWYYRGIAFNQISNTLKALESLLMALRLNPKISAAWNMVGRLYAEMEQFADAAECFQRALVIEPNNSQSLILLQEITKRTAKDASRPSSGSTATRPSSKRRRADESPILRAQTAPNPITASTTSASLMMPEVTMAMSSATALPCTIDEHSNSNDLVMAESHRF